MQSIARRRSLPARIGIVLALVLLIAGWCSQQADALGISYWDSSSAGTCDVYSRYGGSPACSQATVRLLVGQTSYVQKTNVHVRAYFKQRRGQIAIYNYNFCPGNSGGDFAQYGDELASRFPWGSRATSFRFGRHTYYGYYRKLSAGSCNANRQINLQSNDFGYANGLYYVDINITHIERGSRSCSGNPSSSGTRGCDGVENMFELKESSGSGYDWNPATDFYIAQVGDNTSQPGKGYKTTANRLDKSPANLTFVARFGSDCSVTSRTKVRLNYYDMDNAIGAGSNGGAQENGQVKMQLVRVASNGRKYYLTSGGGWSRNSGAGWTPPSRNNVVGYKSFYAYPGDRYVWKMENVYWNNVLQFSTPFDGIYYISPCPSG